MAIIFPEVLGQSAFPFLWLQKEGLQQRQKLFENVAGHAKTRSEDVFWQILKFFPVEERALAVNVGNALLSCFAIFAVGWTVRMTARGFV